jgi:hypothetical protein
MALIVIEGRNGVGFEFFGLSCPFKSLPNFPLRRCPTVFFTPPIVHSIQNQMEQKWMEVKNGSDCY